MAPSAKKLETALIDATCQVFKAEPDATSVNKVRRQAEENLELEDGFFAGEQWKQKSKSLIKEYVEKLLDGWEPVAKKEEKPESKNGVKRQSSEPESPAPKRRKRSAPLKKSVKEESELSDLSEEEKKLKKGKSAVRRKPKPKAPESDQDQDEDIKPSPSADRKRKRVVGDESDEDIKVKKSEASDSDDLSSPPEEETRVKKRLESEEDEKPSKHEDETKPVVDEEEEYSDVIDEPPKPKRRIKEKKEPRQKTAKPSKVESKKAPSPDDPNEAEIKKLQGQLVKCGVRKLWHNELKPYGSDARAKIRHLKKMLADVGMDGRFSEARAREIKETRELLAEAEAAQEMNALWGMNAGGRASRSKVRGKPLKVEDSEGSDEDDASVKGEDEDEEEGKSFAARRRRAQADLAFLGDDSESD
ncbi:hypothetical protein ACO1O0_007533 [Amphichorda felina]